MQSGIVLTLLIFGLTCTVCVAQDGECGPNATHRTCGPACVSTCQNPRRPGSSCIAVCVSGCFCNTGYILDERTKRCVRIFQCTRS